MSVHWKMNKVEFVSIRRGYRRCGSGASSYQDHVYHLVGNELDRAAVPTRIIVAFYAYARERL